jgi:hypothetical protein
MYNVCLCGQGQEPSLLALPKYQTRLDRLARDKCSSLLQKFANYGRKKFYRICYWLEIKQNKMKAMFTHTWVSVPRSGQYYKTLLGIIYTTSSIFPHDFTP